MDEQTAFDKFHATVKAVAKRDYACQCDWCCYRAYQSLNGKTDPGLPDQQIAVQVLHQGPASEQTH